MKKTRALTRGWTILAAFLLATTSVEARTINFAWDPSIDPNLAGYYLLTGTQPGVYTQQITVGKLTTAGNVDVPDGQSFYVAVEAYNTSGVPSVPSNVVITALSLANPGNQTTSEGNVVSLQLTASVVAGRTVTFGAMGLPPGLSVNVTTGVISGTVPFTATGVYPVTASAVDGVSGGANASFSWTILNADRAPLLTSPAAQTTAAGTSVALALVASDPDGDAITFSATGLPPGLTLSATAGTISGLVPTGAAGVYSVTVSVSDGVLSTSRTFAWTVTGTVPPSLPVVTNPGNQVDIVGDVIGFKIAATDPNGKVMTFAATGLPPAMSINASTGRIHGTMRPRSVGTYTVRVSVSDGTGTSQVSFGWIVTLAP